MHRYERKNKLGKLPAIFELGNHLFTLSWLDGWNAGTTEAELGMRNEDATCPFLHPRLPLGTLRSPIFFLFDLVLFSPFSPSAEPGPRLRFPIFFIRKTSKGGKLRHAAPECREEANEQNEI